MKTSTTRKRSAPRRTPAKRKVRKISLFDRFLRTLPFSEGEIQKGFTVIIIGAVIVLAFVIARSTGVTEMAYQQYSDLAVKAGFQVQRVQVNGMKRVDEIKVYDLVLAEKDRAMPQVDVDKIRDNLMEYGWIEDVSVSRRLPDLLVVDITEREPAALWQNDGKLSLVDSSGEILENVPAKEVGNLPRIYGDRANERVAELSELLNEAPSLKPHVIGAKWVGNRRWDLAFKTGETLALPEGRDLALKAILDFARMDGLNQLLGRDIIHFDMRDPDKAYLRKKKKPVPAASKENKKSSSQGTGEAA